MKLPSSIKFKTTEKDKDQRLDVFLAKKLKISRSQAQKMIGVGQIFINKKLPKKAGDRLKTDDKIVISNEARRSEKSLSKSHQTKIPRRHFGSLGMTPAIVAETPDYVVIDKPSGMLAHPTMAKEKNTLADFIVKKYPEIKGIGDPVFTRSLGEANKFTPHSLASQIKKVGDDPMRPGIVHRLDKEASGLMVVARTQKMFEHLKQQFKNRTINKEYFAMVHGKVQRDWGEIDFPIARAKDRMAARPIKSVIPNMREESLSQSANGHGSLVGANLARDDNEKQAKTEFTVEKKFTNFTLLKIKIHTGRMHQIRVHLLAYNHPLVGDPLYFQKKQKRTWDEKLGRLFLHSAKLGFTDLAGNRQTFESPLPKELAGFLKLLK